MPKVGPGASPTSGFFLIIDEKPDGRFFLGDTTYEAVEALRKWHAVGIVKAPWTIEAVRVDRYEYTEFILE